jgi:16S rRNA (cytidine1402-2'-O)-methyltransferase
MTAPAASSGRLVVVGTPIGNLEDLSPRALDALRSAGVMFCEDTRRTRKLLSAMAVPAPRLVRLDGHNEAAMAAAVVEHIDKGAVAVVVTDAGMPTISDPGHLIVRAVAEAGFEVDVVPGPCAVSAALALSGLPASEYRFRGFLPRKGQDRVGALRAISEEVVTTVVYESPHRVVRTVGDLLEGGGPDRAVALAREITKLHQEVWRGTLAGAAAWLDGLSQAPRGEWVIVVGGRAASAEPVNATAADVGARLAAKLAGGADRRQAVAEVAAELDVPKRLVYDVALSLKDG